MNIKEKIIEEIGELIERENLKYNYRIESFFNLLFWKNYSNGYINIEDKSSILKEIEKATDINDYYGEKYTNLNAGKILPFINKIRKQIGLPELTLELNNCLMEMTTEVKKELMLKRLK